MRARSGGDIYERGESGRERERRTEREKGERGMKSERKRDHDRSERKKKKVNREISKKLQKIRPAPVIDLIKVYAQLALSPHSSL